MPTLTLREEHLRMRRKMGIRESLPLYPPRFEGELPRIKALLESRNYLELSKIPDFANKVLATYLKYFPEMEAAEAQTEISFIVDKALQEQH